MQSHLLSNGLEISDALSSRSKRDHICALCSNKDNAQVPDDAITAEIIKRIELRSDDSIAKIAKSLPIVLRSYIENEFNKRSEVISQAILKSFDAFNYKNVISCMVNDFIKTELQIKLRSIVSSTIDDVITKRKAVIEANVINEIINQLIPLP